MGSPVFLILCMGIINYKGCAVQYMNLVNSVNTVKTRFR